ncbi:MFS general substrate transporter, partial [Imleria badia]
MVCRILCMKSLSSLATAVTAGPRVEIYTELVCRGYTPTPALLTLPPVAITVPSTILGNAVSLAQVHLPHHEQVWTTIHTTGQDITTPYPSMVPGACANHPHIQAEIAKLGAVIAIIGGILSCLTTGWWGGFLDRHGRTRTMGIIVFGPLLSDFLTFIVFLFSDTLPGKYWFLAIAPIMEGIMGAPSSVMAAETSYMRDVSESPDLARNFSLLIGIFYAGGTMGPVFGGFLNQRTGSVMAAFYAATVIHIIYALLAWFAMPESISKAMMVHARNRYADELALAVDTDAGPFRRWAKVLVKSFWDSFPLHVLAPKPTQNSGRKDWNLTCLAISAGLINAIMGSGSSIYQYALYTFQWSSLDLGYFISASGLSTVIFLLVILPAIISVWKRVLSSNRHAEEARQGTLFDLHLVRLSSVVFATGYALMGVAPTGLIFTLCFVISTFGLGFLPAVQSVATILHTGLSGEDDTGRLFGALGVVYVLGGRIIGPALYGTMYAVTVSFLPSAILWLSVGCALTAFLALAFVRLP